MKGQRSYLVRGLPKTRTDVHEAIKGGESLHKIQSHHPPLCMAKPCHHAAPPPYIFTNTTIAQLKGEEKGTRSKEAPTLITINTIIDDPAIHLVVIRN
jgi:hypothetical protein